MSNLAALIMPLLLMYLISRLPRPARARPWSYVVLSAAVVFFGYFFINFFSNEVFDTDLSFW
jgi:drug/metabolite transporter (DMT)-like permease